MYTTSLLALPPATRVYIYIDSRYKNKMKGLCGDYNGEANNDFSVSGSDILTSTAQGFGNSWRTMQSCAALHSSTDPSDKCAKHPERSSWATEACSIIRYGQVFATCRAQIDSYMMYYDQCRYDACG